MDSKGSEKSELGKNLANYFISVFFARIESQRFIKNTPDKTINMDPTCHRDNVSLKNNPIDTATTGIK